LQGAVARWQRYTACFIDDGEGVQRRDDGSLAIGEIAARPPGANCVRMNSFAHDADMYRA